MTIETKTQAIIKTALDGFWIVNLEGRLLEVNDSYCQMIGYTREEILKMSIQDVEAAESPEDTARHIDKIKKQGSDLFETRHKCKDGRIIDVEINTSYLNMGKRQIVVFIRDITERKRAEEALLISERKYHTFIESSHEVVFSKDRDGYYHSLNPNAAIGLGGTCIEDVEGKTDYDLLPKEQADALREIDKQVMESGKPIEVEEVVRDVQGKNRIYLSYKWPTYDDKDRIAGISCFATDITERKQAEASREIPLRNKSGRPVTELQKRFINEGFKGLGDGEIIELLLSLVLPAQKAKRLAKACTARFKNLRDFLAASPQELQEIDITSACMFCIKLLKELPAEVLKQKLLTRSVYHSSKEVFDYLYYSMRDLKKEVFKVIYLDNRSQIMDTVDLFEGSRDTIPINPRDIVESSISHGAAGLIFVHNHPTGDPAPSRSDKQLTRDMAYVGEILQIKILDHIIIGADSYFSFADDGLIQKYQDSFLNLKIRGVLASKSPYRHYKNTRPEGFSVNIK